MLLCPEAYTWHPIERCLPLLDKNKYSRLEPNSSVKDSDAIENVNEVSMHKFFLTLTFKDYLRENAYKQRVI